MTMDFNIFKREPVSAINQKSYHKGEDIFELIKKSIREASTSIKVAAAWFTDIELFKELENRLLEPLFSVQIVLDDNKENYWLPFNTLIEKGATVKLLKGTGPYGKMHEKFCVVDEKIVITGSYNWSKNARTENYESVIYSEEPTTVQDFITRFTELLNFSKLYNSVNIENTEPTEAEAKTTIDQKEKFVRDFEIVLEEMIYTSINGYDKEALKQKGYDRSKNSGGDANVIQNELNTIYAELVSDISSSEQKKEVLKSKVNAHLSDGKTKLKNKLEREIEEVEIAEASEKRKINNDILLLEQLTNTTKTDIASINECDIIQLENDIKGLKEKIENQKELNSTPPKRNYILYPSLGALFFLCIYIMLFYSSASYILIYATQDAENAKLEQGIPKVIGIFDGSAISAAWEKGFFNLFFILLFPLMMITFITYVRKIKKMWVKNLSKISGIILIDFFIAYKVAQSIYKTEYIAGKQTELFKWYFPFESGDFYLVFIFGSLALITFDLIINYLINDFEKRNVHFLYKLSLLQIENYNKEIIDKQNEILKCKGKINIKKEIIEDNNNKIVSYKSAIDALPIISKRKKTLLENEFDNEIGNLESIIKIAISKIDNEIFSFSIHYINDRINIFLQGWFDYIYSYFSVSISELKIKETKINSEKWLFEKFPKEKFSYSFSNTYN